MAVLDHEHLLDQAERLIRQRPPGQPRPADIGCAISAPYYALFHCTMTQAEDMVVGSTKRRKARYDVVYHSVDHGERQSCQAAPSEERLAFLTLLVFKRR